MEEHNLNGMSPGTLQGSLASLGLLLALEPIDPEATLSSGLYGWVLSTELSAEDLIDYLATSWQPPPLLTPWNKSSGLWGTKLELPDRLKTDRYRAIQEAVSKIQELFATDCDLLTPTNALKDKTAFIQLMQPILGDWVKALAVPTENNKGEIKLIFPQLFNGTAGAFGKKDLGVDYLKSLEILDGSHKYWEAALFGSINSQAKVRKQPIGTIGWAPGDEGYSQQGIGVALRDSEPANSNPASFVLSLLGASLFAGKLTQEQDSAQQIASFPLALLCSGSRNLSLAEEEINYPIEELWIPEFTEDGFTLADWRSQIADLMAYPLPQQLAKTARLSTWDVAAAASEAGADLGVSRFSRFAFLPRVGQGTNLAVRVGAFSPTTEAKTTWAIALSPYARRLRAFLPKAPKRLQSLGFAVLDQFDQVFLGDPTCSTRNLLSALVRWEAAAKALEDRPRLAKLPAEAWGDLSLYEAFPEFRLAKSITRGRAFAHLSDLERWLSGQISTQSVDELVEILSLLEEPDREDYFLPEFKFDCLPPSYRAIAKVEQYRLPTGDFLPKTRALSLLRLGDEDRAYQVALWRLRSSQVQWVKLPFIPYQDTDLLLSALRVPLTQQQLSKL